MEDNPFWSWMIQKSLAPFGGYACYNPNGLLRTFRAWCLGENLSEFDVMPYYNDAAKRASEAGEEARHRKKFKRREENRELSKVYEEANAIDSGSLGSLKHLEKQPESVEVGGPPPWVAGKPMRAKEKV